jgi:hypothetical protein
MQYILNEILLLLVTKKIKINYINIFNFRQWLNELTCIYYHIIPYQAVHEMKFIMTDKHIMYNTWMNEWMTLYFLHRYEDLQSKIKYQNKTTYLHNICCTWTRSAGLWLIVKVKFVFNQDWLDFFIQWIHKFCYVKHHHWP